jgi:glyoxylase-like metal-dependent hydrolase (beta-lactamase superfamily II)
MDIQSFHEPESGTWSYLLADEATGHAAVIDPVWVYDPVSGVCDDSFTQNMLDTAREKGWQIDWVLETHAHADHLTAADLIRRQCGARIAIGSGIRKIQENFSKVFNLVSLRADGSQFDRLVSEGDCLKVGDLEISVMEAPGHTPDSVVYLAQDAAFIGDTLFKPESGSARCDFPGGDAGMLFDTVQRIHGLPDGTRLYLCHDYPGEDAKALDMVPVEDSRANNIHISANTARDDFIGLRTKRDSGLNLPKLILPALQVNILAGAAPAAESNGASYLKIPLNTSIAGLLGGDGGQGS